MLQIEIADYNEIEVMQTYRYFEWWAEKFAQCKLWLYLIDISPQNFYCDFSILILLTFI
jgi:hypothetical protein